MSISLFINRLARLAALAGFALGTTLAPAATKSGGAKDDFMPYVELAPFVVNGKQLAISIHARSKGDRRYAEDFAESVVKVVYEGVTDSTGKGLVIIGKKGEPHPIFVFRKFLALAEAGKLDPAVAARAPELGTMLNHWQGMADDEEATNTGGDDVDLEFDKIVTALPLPLEGIGAKLYQLAWAEGFNDTKVEAKLRALRVADLEGNMFARFDWVFYLPPKGAFDQMLDELIATALKEEQAGFFERAAVKGALMVVKPTIRRGIESLRRGLLFSAVVTARTDFSEEKVSALMHAYIDAVFNEDKKPGPEHDRAVKAVREQALGFEEKSVDQPDPEPEPAPETEAEPDAAGL